MLITSYNGNLIMFSINIMVILKFTIDFDGTPVSLWFLFNGKFLSECSLTLAKRSVETSGFTMSKCIYCLLFFIKRYSEHRQYVTKFLKSN